MNNADHCRVRVSAAIVRPGDELLVVRESRLALAVINLPGGAPQISETLECAVIREVREETGYHVNPTEIAFVWERRDDRWSTPVLEICFYADIISEARDQPAADDGVFAVEWLPLDHRDVRHHMPYAAFFSTRRRGRYIGTVVRETIS